MVTLLAACVTLAQERRVATDLTPGSTFRDCDVCPEMVVIPPGSYTMGTPADAQDRFFQEGPPRRVSIARAIAVGKYEVTRGEYAQFVRETGHLADGCTTYQAGFYQHDPAAGWRAPGYAQTDRHPVACVSWDDAQAYAAWLSRKSGKPYRLLTEAEWEYAARAGTTTAYYWGDDETNNCQHANGADQTAKAAYSNLTVANCTDNHVYTAPVGAFQPNAFGLHDMAGNVWEWTEDCWLENADGAPGDGSARVTGDCGRRVVRGGSWSNFPPMLRSAVRLAIPASYRNAIYGLRVGGAL